MKAKLRLSLIFMLTFVGAFRLGQASIDYQVMINDQPSKIKVLQDKDSVLVPLTLPASKEPEEWSVSLLRNDKTRRIDVKMASVKRKLRGEVDCYWCNASGECAQDYPAGSGVNFAGASESNCNGTGKCYHCGGTGKL